ncbi:MAG: hypothetical protein KC636_17345 [Myxococcales bacterium]|nr:hypothetical protein [Myxococcales bacterium]
MSTVALALASACSLATPGHCFTDGLMIDGAGACDAGSGTDATTESPTTSDSDTTTASTSEPTTEPTTATTVAPTTEPTTESDSETETETETDETTEDVPVCGNGVVERDEACDDGNDDNTDLCTDACAVASCGDGYTQKAAGEACDPADPELPAACDPATCVWESCGDGALDAHEDCDDANTDEFDGCNFSCLYSQGARALAAGESHTCALLHSGAVRCWGSGADGRLGYANTDSLGGSPDAMPTEDIDFGEGVDQITELVAGMDHSCALSAKGQVFCWGSGAFGKLGYGDTEDIGDDETPGDRGPLLMKDDLDAVTLAAGDHHTCALLVGDKVACWGRGAMGQLGANSTEDIGDDEGLDAIVLLDDNMFTPADISAGGDHSCIRYLSGQVRCWGANESGQLGNGLPDNCGDDEPFDACFGVTTVYLASILDSGRGHSCALVDANGTDAIQCWGRGQSGALGYGDTMNYGDNEPVDMLTVQVGGAPTRIVAGAEHTCAILQGGAVRCWGSGANGRLGYGDTASVGGAPNVLPGDVGPVDLAGEVALEVVAGGGHTCARTSVGGVRCWGRGDAGQLGTGATDDVGDDEQPGDVPPLALNPY